MKPSFAINKNGIGLIDVLLVMTLTVILIPIVYYIYTSTTFTGKINSAQINMQIEGRRSLDTMTDDIKQADSVLNSGSGFSSDADTMVLQIPAKDLTGNLIGTSDTVVYDYSSSTKKLNQHVYPASGSVRIAGSKVIASNVDSFIFKTAALRKDQVKGVNSSEVCLQSSGGGNIGNVTSAYTVGRYVLFPTKSSTVFTIQSSISPGGQVACSVSGGNNTSVFIVNYQQLPTLSQNDTIDLYPYDPVAGGVGTASNLVIVEMTLKQIISGRTAQVILKDDIRLRNK